MTHVGDELPRWDMTGLLVATDPAGLNRARADLDDAINDLTALYVSHGVGLAVTTSDSAVASADVDAILQAVNSTFQFAARLEQVLSCLTSADVTDRAARAALGLFLAQKGRLTALEARFDRWLATLDLDALAAASPLVAAHAFPLRKRQQAANYLMPTAEEDLAAHLGSVGGGAWAQLRNDLETGLTGRMEIDGVEQEVSLGGFDALLSHEERTLRQRAYETRETAYAEVAKPMAAAVNAIKGETLVLTARRGWDDPLDPMLAMNSIDRDTLDALLTSTRAALPLLRRYLRAKARSLGLVELAAYDMQAPVGLGQAWSFSEAAAFITGQFSRFSEDLGAVAERAVREQWIDAGPRAGKSEMVFCAPVGNGASRILLNFAPSYTWVSVLAHELGHAYHVALLHERDRTWLQKVPPPMTLVETASTFCEILVQRAARQAVDPTGEIAILDGWLVAATINIFDGLMAYDLEQAIFAARRDRELTVDELSALSLAVQSDMYGDAVALEAQSHLWTAWHFGQPDIWYYNFPYTFGMLFGLGLYARYEADPVAFPMEFADLLADFALDDANALAGRFGFDLRQPPFWQAGLRQLEADVERFEALAGSGNGHADAACQ